MPNQSLDLNEQTLLEALINIRGAQESELSAPRMDRLIATEAGIALQARRLLDGDLTVAGMRAAGVPDDLIQLTIDTASEMRGTE